ncbi:MAG: hypothetical protein Q8L48_43405 [Archangium sp.]|nr:hypothetical protein [Archangium sp.]
MKIILGLGLVAALCSGCIIVPRHHLHRGHHPAVVVRPDCPPAHHWDGRVCRHNGHKR